MDGLWRNVSAKLHLGRALRFLGMSQAQDGQDLRRMDCGKDDPSGAPAELAQHESHKRRDALSPYEKKAARHEFGRIRHDLSRR